MNSLFFWIIILSFVVPMAMRMYRKSVNKRKQGQGFSGGYPGQFPGQFPGPQSRQPRDGYTQQDYMSGGYREIMSPQPLPPSEPLPPMRPVPHEAPQAPAPATPPPPSGPQGYRARKLAELDQQYSDGELAMEEYMKRRADIMNG